MSDLIFLDACKNNRIDVVLNMLKNGDIIDVNKALLCACKRTQNVSILSALVQYGATNFSMCLIEASMYKNANALELMLKCGARNVNDISETMTIELMNRGYNIRNHYTNSIKNNTCLKHNKIRKLLDNNCEKHYDVNLSHIITDYTGFM